MGEEAGPHATTTQRRSDALPQRQCCNLTVTPRVFVALSVASLVMLLMLLQLFRRSQPYAVQTVRQNAPDRSRLLEECLEDVVTVGAGGRFGNLFMEYASALGVARKHNLTALLPKKIASALAEAFEQVGVASVAEHLATRTASDGTPCSALTEKDAVRTKRHWVWSSAKPTQGEGPVLLPTYIVLEELIAPLAAELRTKLRFREELREGARVRLLAFGEELAKTAGVPTEEVVFIGVHVRRTDYHEHLRNHYHVTQTAGAAYYSHAASWLRQILLATREGDPDAAAPLAVALVVTSDDMAWVNGTLLLSLREDASPNEKSITRVFAAGGGHGNDTLRDLALLAACNHSVISYGTYGITAALLAGGRTVVFSLQNRGYHTMKFVRLLTHWTAIT